MGGTRFALALPSNDLEKSLSAAFATNDLQRICRAVDAGILQSTSIIAVAQAAQIDRTTLYRAFRRKNGPALDTMIKVLGVLGFRLIVETTSEAGAQSNLAGGRSSTARGRHTGAKVTARGFTTAFKTGEIDSLLQVFANALRAQENVSQFARRTIVSREALYRMFTGPKTPRFGTVLSFLNALDLHFEVQRLPHGTRRGHEH
jgi:DNA-binding phage protein